MNVLGGSVTDPAILCRLADGAALILEQLPATEVARLDVDGLNTTRVILLTTQWTVDAFLDQCAGCFGIGIGACFARGEGLI